MSKWIDQLIHDTDCQSDILPGQRSGFLFSLMVLSSYTIAADGRIMHSEMEMVRGFLEQYYGTEQKELYNQILLRLFAEAKLHTPSEWKAKVEQCAREMCQYTTEHQRTLMLAFLARIVRADGRVDSVEVSSLDEVASWLGVSAAAASCIDDLRKEVVMSWTL